MDVHWIATCNDRGVSPYEEEAAILTGEKDVDILTQVDATLSDDGFVTQVMWSSLLESNTDAFHLLRFIKGILGNRTERSFTTALLPVDLRNCRLTTSHWHTVVGLATDLLEREIHLSEESGSTESPWSSLMVECLLLILCPVPPGCDYPEAPFSRICRWLQTAHVRTAIGGYFSRDKDNHNAALLLHTLENNVKRWWKVSDSRYLDILNDVVVWASTTDEKSAELRLLAGQTNSVPYPMILSGALSYLTLGIHKRVLLPQIMPLYRAWYSSDILPDFPGSLRISLASFLNRLEAAAFSHGLASREVMIDYFVVRTTRDVTLAFYGLPAATQFFLRTFAHRQTLCIHEDTARTVQYLIRRTRSREPSYISVAVQGACLSCLSVRV